MDIVNVFKPVVDFFVQYCSIVVVIGGYSFTVGAFILWCIIAMILISFVRGLGD